MGHGSVHMPATTLDRPREKSKSHSTPTVEIVNADERPTYMLISLKVHNCGGEKIPALERQLDQLDEVEKVVRRGKKLTVKVYGGWQEAQEVKAFSRRYLVPC